MEQEVWGVREGRRMRGVQPMAEEREVPAGGGGVEVSEEVSTILEAGVEL